ncbi:hypothetical protein RND81_13G183800 [Saponaria officinalis]|uniref:AAA+ ATPase domain-containing protein n=1 Tax=Saponaria officinalis TaxID=3572 RepID=A0AAW1GZ89_SAPOF
MRWFNRSSYRKDSFTLVINEYTRDNYHPDPNLLYQACQVYLSDKLRSKATRLKGYRTKTDQNNVSYSLSQGERFIETLEDGIELTWMFCCKNNKGKDVDHGISGSLSSRYFELTFDFANKTEVLDGYIPLVLLKYYDRVIEMKKDIFLYTVQFDTWKSVKFNHPFTFDKLALDPELKQSIIDDLDMFIRRKEFYNKVGKAWKRGYLLYGPPGTGKSSLVAAMANYLRFSIYDLQLGAVTSDAVLRRLMHSTTNKSIIVIEDVDCTIGLSRAPPKTEDYNDGCGYDPFDEQSSEEDQVEEEGDDDYRLNFGDEEFYQGRENKGNQMGNIKSNWKVSEYKGNRKGNSNVSEYKGNQKGNVDSDSKLSLSGLLNFIDGLWSSCGDERIIILTTNHKDRLDPAMLRPGRMDMHINMTYLTKKGFRVLAKNYLGVSGEHPLFEEIDTLLEIANVTPAQVAEELIRTEDADVAFSRVVDMLKKKCKENRKIKEGDKKRTIDSIEGKKEENGVVSRKKMRTDRQKE